jgi:hypothetical protein
MHQVGDLFELNLKLGCQNVKAMVCGCARHNPRLRNSVFPLSGFSQNAVPTPPKPRAVRGISIVWQNC